MLAIDLFVQPVSGFIARSPKGDPAPPGTTPDRFVEITRPLAADRPAVTWATHINERPTWNSSAGANARRVEMVMLASVCGYFAFGLGGALGLF